MPAVVQLLTEHKRLFPPGPLGEVFTNVAGGPLRRTLFRSRLWRPALVRAGLLGKVVEIGEYKYRATWPDVTGLEWPRCEQLKPVRRGSAPFNAPRCSQSAPPAGTEAAAMPLSSFGPYSTTKTSQATGFVLAKMSPPRGRRSVLRQHIGRRCFGEMSNLSKDHQHS
jgi:hypothetical protein